MSITETRILLPGIDREVLTRTIADYPKLVV